ncbi:MAG: hypothetical protein UV20_C0009G0033 [Candidatus Magasanikbacteria bacterium GW2011_GWA2_42_32]|uniref:Uncharacterized protein n=1 Tax=Candidatus Magasanikbacteria bacterium GW2011_GWA2_42_32 TaxID=1619039 RepID=A0A0G1A6H8_9BACT|nr:MAG: hypothetical protein UV20_C0009G0033 [Candidatus Magasanikbacteria bacterium GW2011_GWA2_42_32]HBX15891.1 hypothetical protein [Candidatus Magasanikbacteria bacterium]
MSSLNDGNNSQETKRLKSANLSLLSAYQFFAIQKRYEGHPYKRISAEIKQNYGIEIAEGTIKWWFYKGGPLAQCYREYADNMVQLEIEEVQDFIRGNLSKAAKVLAQVMQGMGGPAQVMAAKEFLERGLGKVGEEINLKHSGTVGVAMIDILRAIKEAKNELRENQNNNQSAR